MKKLALVLLAVAALGSMSYAQKGAMSIGGDVGLFMPTGDMGDLLSMGFGICPNFSYMMNEKLAITGTVGYVMWGAKEEIMGLEISFTDMPIKAGAKYYFGEGKMKPYGLGEFGFHMLTAKREGTEDLGILGTYEVDESSSSTEIGISFGAGFEMPMNEKMALNVLAQYESIMDDESFNNIVIKAGIKYDLK
jgi:outer membrane protein W